MRFDDYNYYTTNRLIERQIEKFRSDSRHHKRLINDKVVGSGADLDKDNIEKLDLE